MRRLLVLGLAAALASIGCRSPRSDLVEAELRTKDRQLRELQGELFYAQTMNQALEASVHQQRCSQSPAIRPGYAPSIKDVQLGRGTGGLDEDRIPGDEGIVVVLVPRDIDDSPVKIAGALKVAAFEITPEGLKTPLGGWEVTATELRRSWRTGLFSTGYQVSLPWQRPPTTEKVRIVATFLPLEGGIYEAEKDVTIHVPRVGQSCPPTRVPPPITGPPTLPPPTPDNGAPILPSPTAIPPTSNYPPVTLGPPRTRQ